MNQIQSFSVALSGLLIVACGCQDHKARLSANPSSITITSSELLPGETSTEVTTILRNDGGENLRILSIGSSCSCAVAVLPDEVELVPSQEVSLKLKVSMPVYGRSNASIVVKTNSLRTPWIEINVELLGDQRRLPYVVMQTRKLELTTTIPGEPVHGVVEIVTVERRDQIPAIKMLQSSATGVESIRREPVAELIISETSVQRQYTFDITAACPTSKRHTGELVADIAEPYGNPGKLKTSLSIEVVDAITMVPTEILLEEEADIHKRVILISNDETPFIIHNIVWHRSGVSNQKLYERPETVVEATIHKLDLTLAAPNDRSVTSDSYLEFETSHPRARKCRIGVVAFAVSSASE